ncbi:hypothetical protein F0562_002354 [Nyssa sinensis]|uniref:DUF3741 domain-containing protein n=1 Tax=Nyssa sinensis TaxID=561372 RepID=A0A5J5C9E7_9ASTE|nr:hypothetical protein F0562_002354 [Nyssa sinensis]
MHGALSSKKYHGIKLELRLHHSHDSDISLHKYFLGFAFLPSFPIALFEGVEMNGIQNGKTRHLEKPFPGCLGRMVNLFDLSTGVAGNKLLTDKPHHDGSPLSRSQSDVTPMSPIGDQIEDKVIVSELRRTSNKKSYGTPMKMLIAQEMSKEAESKHNPPGVVAKLMGLDALPRQQPDSARHLSHSRCYSRSQCRWTCGLLAERTWVLGCTIAA